MEKKRNKILTDPKDIKNLIKEAKNRGLFNSKSVEPPNFGFRSHTMGIETARYNYYSIFNGPGDYLEVLTYRIDKDGNKKEDGYMTIYSNGRWGNTKMNRSVSKLKRFLNRISKSWTYEKYKIQKNYSTFNTML